MYPLRPPIRAIPCIHRLLLLLHISLLATKRRSTLPSHTTLAESCQGCWVLDSHRAPKSLERHLHVEQTRCRSQHPDLRRRHCRYRGYVAVSECKSWRSCRIDRNNRCFSAATKIHRDRGLLAYASRRRTPCSSRRLGRPSNVFDLVARAVYSLSASIAWLVEVVSSPLDPRV